MKMFNVTTLVSAAVLSVVAFNAMAAGSNGPKPRCPLGQIAVLEQGSWHCEEAKLKAKETTQRNTSAAPAATLQKAKIKLPDYAVLGAARKMGTTDTFVVQVKNMGTAGAPQGVLFGQHYLKNNQSWGADAIIPPLAPGQAKAITITIPPTNYERGDRMVFTADYFKQLVESNENNNKYAMTYK
ncbi:CARDB domain-containing protein [Sneathiella limimaris]|uniref:CARDB domain-containing protein n=1 Tax=Sneathiella limimaris TaxID=1964213 RepID=UPI00146BB8F8|nr:CARDB domain-containing protein [Sneathiella limimaris]